MLSTVDGETVSRLSCTVWFRLDGYRAECLDMRGCVGRGPTKETALEDLREAVVRVAEEDGLRLAADFELAPVE